MTIKNGGFSEKISLFFMFLIFNTLMTQCSSIFKIIQISSDSSILDKLYDQNPDIFKTKNNLSH